MTPSANFLNSVCAGASNKNGNAYWRCRLRLPDKAVFAAACILSFSLIFRLPFSVCLRADIGNGSF